MQPRLNIVTQGVENIERAIRFYRDGLAKLRSMGAKSCILVGDPGFYERFGFRSPKELFIEGAPQQFVLALPLDDSSASGNVVFHEAFAATD